MILSTPFIHRPVATLLLTLALFLSGGVAYRVELGEIEAGLQAVGLEENLDVTGQHRGLFREVLNIPAERQTASGMPFRSTTRWYLDPALPRSVGLGPVWSPPFWPGR